MDRLWRPRRGRGRRRAPPPRRPAGSCRARQDQRHRQDLHHRHPHRRDIQLRRAALYHAVERRERADAGADPHRRRRPPARVGTSAARRAADAEAQELKAILDTATDGVVVVDREGLVLTFNRSAEALFGYEYHQMARRPFTELFAPESERAGRDYLAALVKNGVASLLNDGREVI